MTNTINVTACDNELIILAYQWGCSYELCRIMSGNSNQVNVKMNLSAGFHSGPINLNGVNNPLNTQLDVFIPAGQYTLLMLGIDWGGPQQFTVNVNNKLYTLPYGNQGDGLVWNSGLIPINV
jgi:hypothetical protein